MYIVTVSAVIVHDAIATPAVYYNLLTTAAYRGAQWNIRWRYEVAAGDVKRVVVASCEAPHAARGLRCEGKHCVRIHCLGRSGDRNDRETLGVGLGH